jgi:MerR family transcriptional regulator, thiopeptide resistance regulator
MARKIGELAAATGLTVRTLHYYEEIGLLPAAERNQGGHRLYSDRTVERLYRICVLRKLGLSLDDIRRSLGDPGWDLDGAMKKHLADLDASLETTSRLRARLAHSIETAGGDEKPVTLDLIRIMEDMTMLDTNVQKRISILVYADMEGAFDYLVRVFGLGPGKLTRDDTGRVVHGELQAGDGVLWLHPELANKLVSPRTAGVSTAMMAVMVDDVDAHFQHAKAQGAPIGYEPVDQPYGYREYSARDHEGGLWSFMKPIA